MLECVVGIHGRKQSGKDTLANMLVKELGFTRISFADRLKEMLITLFDLDRQLIYGSDEDKKQLTWVRWEDLDESIRPAHRYHEEFVSIREMLQIMGTDVFRRYYNRIWIHVWKHEALKCKRVVVADVRFENEIAAARSLSTHNSLIKVVRTSHGLDQASSHESEREMSDDQFNIVVHNDSDYESYIRQCQRIVQVLAGGLS